MSKLNANGIELAYEIAGGNSGEKVILVQGLGYPLNAWPESFVKGLVAQGYQVIRFDNRDVGQSSYMDALGAPSVTAVIGELMQGKPVEVPYSLADMAQDVLGLMDTLNIGAAHVIGMSMGGMIAQEAVLAAPDRFLSLTCIMSSTNNPALPGPSEAVSMHLATPPKSAEPEDLLAYQIKTKKLIGSPAYPMTDAEVQAFVLSLAMRGIHPQGIVRQTLAVLTAGDRRARLAEINLPTLVLHGEDDPLVPVECGLEIANSVTGAELTLFPGMGHEIPTALVDDMIQKFHALVSHEPHAAL